MHLTKSYSCLLHEQVFLARQPTANINNPGLQVSGIKITPSVKQWDILSGSSGGGLAVGAIAGIVIGSLAAVGIIGGLIYFFVVRRRRAVPQMMHPQTMARGTPTIKKNGWYFNGTYYVFPII
jgi:hypothetical protein